MDKELLKRIRTDSLSKHEGAIRKYGSLSLDTCKTVVVNRTVRTNTFKVAFEESDGWCHGLNVPTDWLKEDHIAEDRMTCLRCGGAGKLTLYGIDCTECKGTGMVASFKGQLQ